MPPSAKPILIDSSVYLSALLPSDTYHEDSKKFFNHIKAEKAPSAIVVPFLVILEIFNNLHKNNVTAFDEFILYAFLEQDNSAIIALDVNFLSNIYLPHYRKLSLKTADSITAVTAIHYQAILISWDQKILEETKKFTPSLTPKQFLKEY